MIMESISTFYKNSLCQIYILEMFRPASVYIWFDLIFTCTVPIPKMCHFSFLVKIWQCWYKAHEFSWQVPKSFYGGPMSEIRISHIFKVDRWFVSKCNPIFDCLLPTYTFLFCYLLFTFTCLFTNALVAILHL